MLLDKDQLCFYAWSLYKRRVLGSKKRAFQIKRDKRTSVSCVWFFWCTQSVFVEEQVQVQSLLTVSPTNTEGLWYVLGFLWLRSKTERLLNYVTMKDNFNKKRQQFNVHHIYYEEESNTHTFSLLFNKSNRLNLCSSLSNSSKFSLGFTFPSLVPPSVNDVTLLLLTHMFFSGPNLWTEILQHCVKNIPSIYNCLSLNVHIWRSRDNHNDPELNKPKGMKIWLNCKNQTLGRVLSPFSRGR